MQLNMYHIQCNTLIQSEKWYHKNHEVIPPHDAPRLAGIRGHSYEQSL